MGIPSNWHESGRTGIPLCCGLEHWRMEFFSKQFGSSYQKNTTLDAGRCTKVFIALLCLITEETRKPPIAKLGLTVRGNYAS